VILYARKEVKQRDVKRARRCSISLHKSRRGRDDIKAFMTDFRRAFPDLNFWGTADLIAPTAEPDVPPRRRGDAGSHGNTIAEQGDV
jgi:hypothetical protein